MHTPESHSLDLGGYFERIDYRGPRQPDRPDLKTLRAIHLAHATHIPFENVDVLLGKPIQLDLPSLEAKLVRDRRGGYCFEQNALLAAALEQVGFGVTRLLARVRVDSERLLPRTHMVLEVAADGRSWLADVGFGAWGLLEPLPLAEGESRQYAWPYRLRRVDREWFLEASREAAWHPLYSFTTEPQLPIDYEPANFYTSTHNDSRFVHTLTAQLPLPETRYLLRGRELMVATVDGMTTRVLEDDAELLAVLAEHFRLNLEPGPWIPGSAGSSSCARRFSNRPEAGMMERIESLNRSAPTWKTSSTRSGVPTASRE